MQRSIRSMRLVILSHLFRHLKAIYHLEWPRKVFRSGRISDHEIDALLAYKSDPHLEGLHAALVRLEKQDYGFCLVCARPINQILLDEDPTRRLCVECEQTFNSRQTRNKAV